MWKGGISGGSFSIWRTNAYYSSRRINLWPPTNGPTWAIVKEFWVDCSLGRMLRKQTEMERASGWGQLAPLMQRPGAIDSSGRVEMFANGEAAEDRRTLWEKYGARWCQECKYLFSTFLVKYYICFIHCMTASHRELSTSILTVNQGPDTIPTQLSLPYLIGNETEALRVCLKLKEQNQDSNSGSLATCPCP